MNDDARRLRNLRRRVDRARKSTANTCGASLHLHVIAERLAAGKPCDGLADDPRRCAETMLAVLESLFRARAELARLEKERAMDEKLRQLVDEWKRRGDWPHLW